MLDREHSQRPLPLKAFKLLWGNAYQTPQAQRFDASLSQPTSDRYFMRSESLRDFRHGVVPWPGRCMGLFAHKASFSMKLV